MKKTKFTIDKINKIRVEKGWPIYVPLLKKTDYKDLDPSEVYDMLFEITSYRCFQVKNRIMDMIDSMKDWNEVWKSLGYTNWVSSPDVIIP